MQPVVVYDINILWFLAASVGERTPYHCIELARQGKVEGLTCQEILDGLAEETHHYSLIFHHLRREIKSKIFAFFCA